MGDYAEDALDLELEGFLNESEFGEDYQQDWPIDDGLGGSIPVVRKRSKR